MKSYYRIRDLKKILIFEIILYQCPETEKNGS